MLELQVKLNKKNITLEKVFTTEYLRLLKAKGFFIYKIPDGSLGMKPFDCIVSTNINSYYIEIKVIEGDIFNLNILRQNQWASLKKNYELKSNNESLIIIYSKKYNNYKIVPFSIIANLSQNDRIKLEFMQD